MKPYLIGRQWLDLDHVLAIEEHRFTDGSHCGHWGGRVTLAFLNEPLHIRVGKSERNRYLPPFGEEPCMTPEEAQALWDRFIEAWKHRDSPPQLPASWLRGPLPLDDQGHAIP